MGNLDEAVKYPSGYKERWLENGLWTDEHPFDWIEKWASKTPDNPAITSPDGSITYAEFNDRVLRCAGGFYETGIGQGDAVALQLPNTPEMLIAYHGLQRIGAVPTLLHMPYRKGDLVALLNYASVKAIVCWAGIEAYDAPSLMLELRKEVAGLEQVYVAGGTAPDGTTAFDDLYGSELIDIPKPAPDAPCVFGFTSGTSSAPKGIVHSFYSMSSTHRLLSARCGLVPNDRVLSAPPFTHIYGICIAGITLHAGAASVLMETYSPAAFAEALAKYKSTVMFCAPAHVLGALHTGMLTPEVTGSLKTAVLAGAACPVEVFTRVEDTFTNATIYQMFGMTEILMSMINPLDAPREVRLTSIGTVSDGHEIRVCRPGGEVLDVGEEGELEFRGAFLFAGYFNNEEANRSSIRTGGWFRSGDLGKLDSDGNVYITGRIKDIINRGGIKINPIDIEAIIDKHPKIFFSAIVPMPDPILGEKACLFVQLKPGEAITLNEVLEYLGENGVAKMKWPERLEKIDVMPMTPTRKIIKGELLRELEKR